MTTSIWSQFETQAQTRPASIAVHDRGEDYSYADVREAAIAFSNWLETAGTAPGDRVAFVVPNCVQYVACYLGTLKAGRVAVPLNPEMSTEELQTILQDCRPAVVVLGDKAQRFGDTIARLSDRIGIPRATLLLAASDQIRAIGTGRRAVQANGQQNGTAHVLPRRLRDVAQIIYTSGTTGRPKGVMLTHQNLVANCRSIVSYLSLTERDSMLVVLPFFYSYGNSLLITHLAVGGRLVLASDFVFWNRILDLMEKQRVTGFAGVPSTFALLLFRSNAADRDFRDLRYLTCAGGGLLPCHVEKVRDIFPGRELFLMYGQTEATARLSTLMPEEIDLKPGSIGRGIHGVTLTVLDETGHRMPPGEVGEIVARGPNLMMGYWNDPDGTDQVLRPEGLRTGDLAYTDEDGYIYIVGRNSDMIKSGSYRISPHEIEDVLLRRMDVAEVAVVGHPDDVWGEIPVAFIVPTESAELDSETLLEACRRELPRYKQPRSIHIVEALPKTPSGKIRRSSLREAIAS